MREIFEHLDLRSAVLVGWSMGGEVVLSYYEQYGGEGRLKAVGLVDTAPFPFSPAEWNSHALRNYNYDGMNATLADCTTDLRKFAIAFTTRMFKQKPSDADVDWVVAEMMKTPTWIAKAVYSDFVMSDYTKSLAKIQVPVIVFAANSGVFRNGIAMGKATASHVPHGTLVPFEDAGHMLFYEQSHKFNAALREFIKIALGSLCRRHVTLPRGSSYGLRCYEQIVLPDMSTIEWDCRIARAHELARTFPFAAELLNFYERIAVFQKAVYEQVTRDCPPAACDVALRDQLDLEPALQHLPPLFSIVERHGPPGLAGVARSLRERGQQQWIDLLAASARGDGPRGDPAYFFARVCLQPIAECIANSSHKVQVTSYTGSLCPLCSSRPQLAVLRPEGDGAKRSLVCSFCLTEWNFRRVVCPACAQESKDKLPRYSAPEFPYVRVEACDACKMYLKSVDLSINGRAVPIVDEIAAAPLDLWAVDHGYSKIELNLVNC